MYKHVMFNIQYVYMFIVIYYERIPRPIGPCLSAAAGPCSSGASPCGSPSGAVLVAEAQQRIQVADLIDMVGEDDNHGHVINTRYDGNNIVYIYIL